MNTLRRMCAATALSLLLAVSALAGQIPSGGIVSPPPPASATSTTTTTTSTDLTTTVILTVLSLLS